MRGNLFQVTPHHVGPNYKFCQILVTHEFKSKIGRASPSRSKFITSLVTFCFPTWLRSTEHLLGHFWLKPSWLNPYWLKPFLFKPVGRGLRNRTYISLIADCPQIFLRSAGSMGKFIGTYHWELYWYMSSGKSIGTCLPGNLLVHVFREIHWYMSSGKSIGAYHREFHWYMSSGKSIGAYYWELHCPPLCLVKCRCLNLLLSIIAKRLLIKILDSSNGPLLPF